MKKPKGWSIADFSEKAFQLFDGERTTVELLCHKDAMNSVIDHFGEQAIQPAMFLSLRWQEEKSRQR